MELCTEETDPARKVARTEGRKERISPSFGSVLSLHKPPDVDLIPEAAFTLRVPCFGSISELLHKQTGAVWNSSVVDALTIVLTNARSCAISGDTLAISTCTAIEATIPLLKDNNDRGKQQAMLIFAFLVNGRKHAQHMETLSSLSDGCNLVAYEDFLKLMAPPASEAATLMNQALRRGIYAAEGLEAVVPNYQTDIVTFLKKRARLLESGFFANSCHILVLPGANGKFDRHIPVDHLYDESVKRIQMTLDDACTALVYGESGSGKTVSSILSAGKGGLCIFLTPVAIVNDPMMWQVVDVTLSNEAEAYRRHTRGAGLASQGRGCWAR